MHAIHVPSYPHNLLFRLQWIVVEELCLEMIDSCFWGDCYGRFDIYGLEDITVEWPDRSSAGAPFRVVDILFSCDCILFPYFITLSLRGFLYSVHKESVILWQID